MNKTLCFVVKWTLGTWATAHVPGTYSIHWEHGARRLEAGFTEWRANKWQWRAEAPTGARKTGDAPSEEEAKAAVVAWLTAQSNAERR